MRAKICLELRSSTGARKRHTDYHLVKPARKTLLTLRLNFARYGPIIEVSMSIAKVAI